MYVLPAGVSVRTSCSSSLLLLDVGDDDEHDPVLPYYRAPVDSCS